MDISGTTAATAADVAFAPDYVFSTGNYSCSFLFTVTVTESSVEYASLALIFTAFDFNPFCIVTEFSYSPVLAEA